MGARWKQNHFSLDRVSVECPWHEEVVSHWGMSEVEPLSHSIEFRSNVLGTRKWFHIGASSDQLLQVCVRCTLVFETQL